MCIRAVKMLRKTQTVLEYNVIGQASRIIDLFLSVGLANERGRGCSVWATWRLGGMYTVT